MLNVADGQPVSLLQVYLLSEGGVRLRESLARNMTSLDDDTCEFWSEAFVPSLNIIVQHLCVTNRHFLPLKLD